MGQLRRHSLHEQGRGGVEKGRFLLRSKWDDGAKIYENLTDGVQSLQEVTTDNTRHACHMIKIRKRATTGKDYAIGNPKLKTVGCSGAHRQH